MNASALRRIVTEDSEPVFATPPQLSDFDRGHSKGERSASARSIGLGLAAAVHAVLLIGFFLAGPSIKEIVVPNLTVVTLQPETVAPADLPPAPKLEPVAMPEVEAPDIIVQDAVAPTTISVAPPPPAEAVAPPSPASNQDYFGRLLAKLYSYKRYPEAARLNREKGVAVIRIVMERDGTVSGVTLIKSSGSEALDQEAVSLPMRAQPLPAMPASMPQERLTMNVNVDFLRAR